MARVALELMGRRVGPMRWAIKSARVARFSALTMVECLQIELTVHVTVSSQSRYCTYVTKICQISKIVWKWPKSYWIHFANISCSTYMYKFTILCVEL